MRIPTLFASSLAALTVLVQPAAATWSIVVINRDTGEVCAATATCLPNFDIKLDVPLVRVGIGAAASQSFVHPADANKILIWDGFTAGKTPKVILDEIKASDANINLRQFGIASFDGPPVTFTGAAAGRGEEGCQRGASGPTTTRSRATCSPATR